MRFADLGKHFVGKEKMLARQPRSKIALLALAGEETEALMGEAVYHDGRLAGSITSAAYGHSVGRSLAIAFLRDGAGEVGARLSVSILGKPVAAEVLGEAQWDPGNDRLRM